MIHKMRSISTDGYCLIGIYEKGEIVKYDMSSLLSRNGSMIQPLKDESFFKKVFLQSGSPTWPNGYDLCSEMIYRDGVHIGYEIQDKLHA